MHASCRCSFVWLPSRPITSTTNTNNNLYQKLIKTVNVLFDEFEKRYGIATDRKSNDECMQFPIKLPNHLIGIFNEAPRLVPKGVFLGNSQQMARSRTLSMFSSNISSNFRGSVPDLSRSVPNTPVFYKQDRSIGVVEKQAYTSSMPRRPNKITAAPSVPTSSGSKAVGGPTKLKQDADEEDRKDKIIEIKTSSSAFAANSIINDRNQPVLTTFRASLSPSSSIFRDHSDDLVIDRFSRKSLLSDEESVNLREQAHSLLHSSSSFIIKRPSFLPERNSTMIGSSSFQNIHEKPLAEQSVKLCDGSVVGHINMAAKKAAALLDEVQPTLRTSTKYKNDPTHAEEASYEGLMLRRAPKYEIPRIISTTATEKNDNKNMDSAA